ncbi:MAG: hypothetical protein ACKO0N_03385 [Planctomycetota bacterium]
MLISRLHSRVSISGICLAAALYLAAGNTNRLSAQESPQPPAIGPSQKGIAEAKSPAELKQAEDKRLASEEAALKRKPELLAFAEEHDPQLRALLEMLETKRPKQFRQALANLARDTDRLNALQTRDPERYDLELLQWKNNQRVQILSAKLTLKGGSPEGKDELKKLLARKTELRQESLQLELRRARERVARLEEQTGKFTKPSDSELEKQVEQMLSRAKKSGSGTSAPPKADAVGPKKGDQQ